jgi:capsular polysaccharide biosynthesis protein
MLQIRLLISTLKRSWWIIIISTIMAINIALFLSYREDPLYRTQARFVVSPNPSVEDPGDYVDGVNSLDSLVATYAEILDSRTIRKQAIAELEDAPDNIGDYNITAVVLPGSSILELTVVGFDPPTTARLTNTIGQEAMKYIKGSSSVYDITLLDAAGVPNDPISPNPQRDAGLAAVMGLVFGAAIAVVREQVIVALNS